MVVAVLGSFAIMLRLSEKECREVIAKQFGERLGAHGMTLWTRAEYAA